MFVRVLRGKKKKIIKKKQPQFFLRQLRTAPGARSAQPARCYSGVRGQNGSRWPTATWVVWRSPRRSYLRRSPRQKRCVVLGGGQGERLNPKEGAEGCAACPSALLRAGVTGRVVSLVSREQQRVDQPNRASPGACSFGCPRQKGARPALQRRSVFKDRAVRFIYVTVQLSLPGAAEQVSGFVGVSLCFTSVSEASICC